MEFFLNGKASSEPNKQCIVDFKIHGNRAWPKKNKLKSLVLLRLVNPLVNTLYLTLWTENKGSVLLVAYLELLKISMWPPIPLTWPQAKVWGSRVEETVLNYLVNEIGNDIYKTKQRMVLHRTIQKFNAENPHMQVNTRTAYPGLLTSAFMVKHLRLRHDATRILINWTALMATW